MKATYFRLTTSNSGDFFMTAATTQDFTNEREANAAYIAALKAGKIGNLRRITTNRNGEELTNTLIAAL